jgi:hypothetical protein
MSESPVRQALAHLRWRFSPQGREAYRAYAQGRAEVARLTEPGLQPATRARRGDWTARERRQRGARHRAGIPAANERARAQTRAATAETGADWPDGRWERTRWENGRPARTYRGTRRRT